MAADDNEWRLQGQDSSTLLDCLDQILPGFRQYMRNEGLFDSASLHGVFASCSHFVRNQPQTVETWMRLAVLLNSFVDGSDSRLDNAASTCFLENLAEPGHPLGPLLKGKAREFWTELGGS